MGILCLASKRAEFSSCMLVLILASSTDFVTFRQLSFKKFQEGEETQVAQARKQAKGMS